MLIVADDLTGAADSAGAFAVGGYPCVVVLDGGRHDGATNASIVAVDTNARVGTEDDAFLANSAAVRVHPQRPVFVKIDSTLRGHIRAGIMGAMSALEVPPKRVVVCPAFPALGRTVVDAQVHLEGVALEAGNLRDALAGFPAGAGLFIPAARNDDDIAAVVQRFADPLHPHETLWVGSAGLARHLVRLIATPPEHVDERISARRIAIVAGTQNDRTEQQLGVMDATFLRQHDTQVFRIDPRDTSYLTQIVPTLRKADGLVLTGGHTARVVLEALGIGRFTVLGEIEPGVPWATVSEPAVTLVTKAGGFGDPGTLRRAVEFLQWA